MAKTSSPNAIFALLTRFVADLCMLYIWFPTTFGRQGRDPEYVRKYGIYFLLLLSTPLFAETLYKIVTNKKRELLYLEKETQKRMRTLTEIINTNLHFRGRRGGKSERAKGKLSLACWRRYQEHYTSLMELNDNIEDDDSDEMIGPIYWMINTKIESMVCAIEDVEEIDDEVPVLREAFCPSQEYDEMKDALKKTIAQDDEELRTAKSLGVDRYVEWLQSKLVGTPWNFEDFYRNPTKYFVKIIWHLRPITMRSRHSKWLMTLICETSQSGGWYMREEEHG